MIKDQDGDIYLSYSEYSEKYGLSEPVIRQRVHRGTIWVKKIGRRSYIWEGEIPSVGLPGRPKGSKNKKKKT